MIENKDINLSNPSTENAPINALPIGVNIIARSESEEGNKKETEPGQGRDDGTTEDSLPDPAKGNQITKADKT